MCSFWKSSDKLGNDDLIFKKTEVEAFGAQILSLENESLTQNSGKSF